MDNIVLTAVTDRALGRLPQELRDQIIGHAFPSISPSPLLQLPSMVQTISFDPSHNPAIPPADRSKSPIKALPDELIRQIFAESLPAKGATIKCLCGDALPKAEDHKPKRNRTSDLMTVCKKFKETVKLAVYQERFFEVHVHQGGTGGVELLDVGYQPLAYMESGSDDRFAKFTTADEYGFQHLKKIKISIFPTTDSKRSKAVSMNTYFMVQALCRLLERGPKEQDRLVSLTITFPRAETDIDGVGRHNIMSNKHYWWDPTTQQPRTSSLHNLPDIELVLHPFARLTRVHNVNIVLPTEIMNHAPTKNFVDRLSASMTSSSSLPTLLLSDDQENFISSMRQEVEDYIFAQKYGKTLQNVEKFGESDMEVDGAFEDDFGSDDDSRFARDLKRAMDASLDTISRADTGKRRKLELDDSALDQPTREQIEEQTALLDAFSGYGQALSKPSSSAWSAELPLTGLLHRERRAAAAPNVTGIASPSSSVIPWPSGSTRHVPVRSVPQGGVASLSLEDGEIDESKDLGSVPDSWEDDADDLI